VAGPAPSEPRFRERPTEAVVRDAWALAALPLAGALFSFVGGFATPTLVFLLLAGGVVAFFRNPARAIAGDERTAVAPADGRVLEVGEVEEPDGRKALRIGIFLSIFDVHVNRMPLAGRVVAIDRGGDAFLAAWNAEAPTRNVRCALTLETAAGLRFRVVQITGLVARRIVCHPRVGEWVERGARYGLIRFGSRTDVILPPEAQALVRPGDRVRGGATAVARLGGAA
jgi:phosphatidylserine decarboxylase